MGPNMASHLAKSEGRSQCHNGFISAGRAEGLLGSMTLGVRVDSRRLMKFVYLFLHHTGQHGDLLLQAGHGGMEFCGHLQCIHRLREFVEPQMALGQT